MVKKATKKKAGKETTDSIVEQIETRPKDSLYVPLDTSMVISTGSTLLDLAISGSRIRGGGLPGGIIVEIFGPPSAGKTALLVEICSSAQAGGGEVLIADPEARLDKEYASLFGLKIPKEIYRRPNTVTELSDLIWNWAPKKKKVINVLAADSLAAISTNLEMGEGDKRGQQKPKELSQLCRKVGRKIALAHQLLIFTNQERQGEFGRTTPGGFAVPFHASQ
jgi:RecA/RadA recombinase